MNLRSKTIRKDKEAKLIDDQEKIVPEMKKQLHNLYTILRYTNATPFKDRNDAGFICAYCFKTFPDPEVLKDHTIKDHGKEKFTYKRSCSSAMFIALLDIADLECSVCDQPFESLNQIRHHLVNAHKKKLYGGLTDYIQPFKLTKEQLVACCLCDQQYNSMKLLMMHMNDHYRNFICPVCGAGFVNSFRLGRHETTHEKKRSFACRHCKEAFETKSKLIVHANAVHKGLAGYSVCQLCKERFKNYYQKTRHMVKVHNADFVCCDMCDKKFHLKSNLIQHMRQVHLKERSYECPVCRVAFFCKRHMTGHYLAVHTNERKYQCDVCGKAFPTRDACRSHLRKIHGVSKKGTQEEP